MKHAMPTIAAAAIIAAIATTIARTATDKRVKDRSLPKSEDRVADEVVGRWHETPLEETRPRERLKGTADLPRHILDKRQTDRETAGQVRLLLKLRSRVDRVAWNTLGHGPYGSRPMPGIRDWEARCMLLVAIGSAFEDMPEVLEHALRDPEGTSTHRELLHRAIQAHAALGTASVPARWSQDAMEDAWHDLCDAVAAIIGQEPDYGTRVPHAGPVRSR